jgi:phosphoserine phosphatase RsbU/P
VSRSGRGLSGIGDVLGFLRLAQGQRDEARPAERHAVSDQRGGATVRILIADNSASSRLLLQQALTGWGYEVHCVEDGRSALAALEASDTAFVIADWSMPEVDGLELCRRIRAMAWDRYVYIVMLTVRDKADDLAEAIEAGADDFVVKPFSPIELRARIKAGERVVTLERELKQKIAELQGSLKTIRRLEALLPICVYCKKVRNDQNYWQQLDDFVHEQTGSAFSHGICPDCYENVVAPELETWLKDEKRTDGGG